MPFSSYALSVLLLLGLLCDTFTLTSTAFLAFLFEDIIMYSLKLIVAESSIHFLVIFCLVPGYDISYSESCFY